MELGDLYIEYVQDILVQIIPVIPEDVRVDILDLLVVSIPCQSW